ncbi:MAG: hypothetical protein L0177_06935, partial [Chloroflexi bacterium]|nr:hypothetical protein [Chloroflexota bacterium]
GCGRIFDLDDWRGRTVSKLLLARVGGESLKASAALGEEIEASDVARLTSLLYAPISRIEITGEDFMPYSWDNGEYARSLQGKASLVASNPRNPGVQVAYFGNGPRAIITRESGEIDVKLEPCAYTPPDDWLPMNSGDAAIFSCALANRPFKCPRCGDSHSPKTIQCLGQQAIFGEPVFSFLEDHWGFALIKNDGGRACYRLIKSEIARVGNGAVAVKSGSRAWRYEYDAALGRWTQREEVAPYYRVGDEYILVA